MLKYPKLPKKTRSKKKSGKKCHPPHKTTRQLDYLESSNQYESIEEMIAQCEIRYKFINLENTSLGSSSSLKRSAYTSPIRKIGALRASKKNKGKGKKLSITNSLSKRIK